MEELNEIYDYLRKEEIKLYHYDTGEIAATYIETFTAEYFSINPKMITSTDDEIIFLLLLIVKRSKIKNNQFITSNSEVIPQIISNLIFKYKLNEFEALKNENKK